MRLTKWVKIDQMIENYKKDYPKRWKSFVVSMDRLRKQDTIKRKKGGFSLGAKFPTYPDEERDISSEIIKIIPDFIMSDYKWNKFKKKYPVFFR
jgi:hypothetical protein